MRSLKVHLPLVAYLAAVSVFSEAAPSSLLDLQPSGNLVVGLGSNRFRSCVFTPSDPNQTADSLQWLNPQREVVPGTGRIHAIAEGNSVQLFINDVQSGDEGAYTCQAEHEGKSYTKSFNLSTYMGITFQDFQAEQKLVQGGKSKIDCQVKSVPEATISWKKDRVPIRSGGRYVVHSDGLEILNVTSNDNGAYLCSAVVAELGNFEERTINVVVVSLPEIVSPQNGTDIVLTEGQVLDLECKVNGNPLASVRWDSSQVDNAHVVKENSSSSDSSVLPLGSVERTMQGVYVCIAENEAGVVEAHVNLVVQSKPEIRRFENVTADEKTAVSLQCEVWSPLQLTVEFRKVSNNLTFAPGVLNSSRVVFNQSRKGDVTMGVLTFSRVAPDDAGAYQCVATNKVGASAAAAALTVRHAPVFERAVTLPRVISWLSEPRNLSCAVRAHPAATLAWRMNGREISAVDKNIVVLVAGNPSILQVTAADTSYFTNYSCVATNELGESVADIQLVQVFAPSPPGNVQVKMVTASSVVFTWPAPGSDGGAAITAYLVQYRLSSDAWQRGDRVHVRSWAASADHSYHVTDLEPEQSYAFRFASRNMVGNSSWTKDYMQKTKSVSAPEPPVFLYDNLTAVAKGAVMEAAPDGTHVVYWRVGDDNGKPIQSLTITYFKVTNTSQSQPSGAAQKYTSAISSLESGQYRLQTLDADSLYRVELRAENSIGEGEPAVLYFRTTTDMSQVATSTSGHSRLPAGAIVAIVLVVLLAVLVLLDLAACLLAGRGLIFSARVRWRAARSTAKPKSNVPATERERQPLNELQTTDTQQKVKYGEGYPTEQRTAMIDRAV